MHRVNSCCCGCTLRTGTLILTISSLLLGIFDILSISKPLPGAYFVFESISIITAALAIYGALQEKSSWLVPYVVMQFVSLAICVIFMLIIPFIVGVLITALIPKVDKKTKDMIEEGGAGVIICIEILLAVYLALGYYFTVVVYSFYKQLKTGILPGPV